MKLRLPSTLFPQLPLLAFRMEEATTAGLILNFREKLESGKYREKTLGVTFGIPPFPILKEILSISLRQGVNLFKI